MFAGGIKRETCKFTQEETSAQVFSCELCKISNIILFTEHVWATASTFLPVVSALKRRTVNIALKPKYFHPYAQNMGRGTGLLLLIVSTILLKVQPCKLKKHRLMMALHASKVFWKFRIPTSSHFTVIYPRSLLFSYKVAYFLTVSIVFSVYKPNFMAK